MELGELQRLIGATYGERDHERGVPSTVAWLTEELGELAQAVRKGGRYVHVGIFEHHHGRVATQFHRRFQHLIGSRVQQLAANAGGAGKADNAHTRVMQHVIDEGAGPL